MKFSLRSKGKATPKKRRTNKKKTAFNEWLTTYTKKAVTLILVVALIDLQLTYVLAFMGREYIAETLSSTIAETIVGVMVGYFLKALFETFFEKREERLTGQTSEADPDPEPEEVTVDEEDAVG